VWVDECQKIGVSYIQRLVFSNVFMDQGSDIYRYKQIYKKVRIKGNPYVVTPSV